MLRISMIERDGSPSALNNKILTSMISRKKIKLNILNRATTLSDKAILPS